MSLKKGEHLEKLLKIALDTKAEFVYGALQQNNLVTGEKHLIYSSPPEFGKIGLQGSLYMKALDDIYKYDFHSYLLDEVADWTMIRRMMESGIKINTTKEVVGILNMIPPGTKQKDY